MQQFFHRPLARRGRLRGITLLELMIVLVIVGILAGVGYPAYVDYANRARRSDGKALLMDAAARQERYFFDNNQYANTTALLGYGGGTVESAEGNYTLNAPTAGNTGSTNTSYTLTAVPNAGKPFIDPDCGNLTLDSRGTQGVTGTDSVDDCWGR